MWGDTRTLICLGIVSGYANCYHESTNGDVPSDSEEGTVLSRARLLDKRLTSGDYRGVLDQAEAEFMKAGDRSSWVAVDICRAAGALGEWGKLVTWAERGLASGPDPEANAWLHLLQGTGLMYVGDPLRAERSLRLFVETTPRPSSVLYRLYPDGWFNLGCLMRLLRRTDEEVRCFERAVAAFEAVNRTCQAQYSRLELAFGHLLAGNPTAARPLLDTVTGDLLEEPDAALEAFALTCWAHYHRLTGDLAASQQVCERLLERADLPAGSRAEALLVMSCNTGDLGQERESAALLERAYADALVHWSPSQLQRVEARMGQLAAKQAGR